MGKVRTPYAALKYEQASIPYRGFHRGYDEENKFLYPSTHLIIHPLIS